jgi:hypothetical protein
MVGAATPRCDLIKQVQGNARLKPASKPVLLAVAAKTHSELPVCTTTRTGCICACRSQQRHYVGQSLPGGPCHSRYDRRLIITSIERATMAVPRCSQLPPASKQAAQQPGPSLLLPPCLGTSLLGDRCSTTSSPMGLSATTGPTRKYCTGRHPSAGGLMQDTAVIVGRTMQV